MSNIGLVISREYLTRVKSKSFLVTTLLVPIVLILTFGLVIYITSKSSSEKTIAIIDQSSYFVNKLEDTKSTKYKFLNTTVEEAKAKIKDETYDAVLVIPSFGLEEKATVTVYANEQLGMSNQSSLEDNMNQIMEDIKLSNAGINKEQLTAIKQPVISFVQKIGAEEKEADNTVAYIIAYASGMLLYFLMVIYGTSVMKSVMEEKTNRIAEIIISSVKPFDLMIGKIIGVAMVGLTQFVIWIAFIALAYLAISLGIGIGGFGANPEMLEQAMAAQNQMPTGSMNDMAALSPKMAKFFQVVNETNWFKIISWFIFYFLGGYFLYAALFAAVGSLMTDESSDNNSLTLPITMPIFLGFLIMVNALNDPNSGVAVFGSIFPLTSPIVMMARLPFDAPTWWELALSVIFMIIGFLLTTWAAAKIYRIGILMHGKKVSFKDIGKLLFRKS